MVPPAVQVEEAASRGGAGGHQPERGHAARIDPFGGDALGEVIGVGQGLQVGRSSSSGTRPGPRRGSDLGQRGRGLPQGLARAEPGGRGVVLGGPGRRFPAATDHAVAGQLPTVLVGQPEQLGEHLLGVLAGLGSDGADLARSPRQARHQAGHGDGRAEIGIVDPHEAPRVPQAALGEHVGHRAHGAARRRRGPGAAGAARRPAIGRRPRRSRGRARRGARPARCSWRTSGRR